MRKGSSSFFYLMVRLEIVRQMPTGSPTVIRGGTVESVSSRKIERELVTLTFLALSLARGKDASRSFFLPTVRLYQEIPELL